MSIEVIGGLAIVVIFVGVFLGVNRLLKTPKTPRPIVELPPIEVPPEPKTPATVTTVEYWEEQSAADIPIEDFNELFEQGKIVIEKETFGYTTDYEKWVSSDAKYHIPKNCGPALYLMRDFSSFATAESFMVNGVVYAMDVREPKMFSTTDELLEYAKTLFAVYLVYVGVSPIDKKTERLFIVGCTADSGVVPTHGL